MLEDLEAIFVLSLPDDNERRAHVAEHFGLHGIKQFTFINAQGPTSEAVKNIYRKGLVKGYPGCFRCGEHSCYCENNILIPQQVANWVSFIGLWKRVASMSGPVLICEDDVYFYEGAFETLRLIKPALANILSSSEALVRLGRSGLPITPGQLTNRQAVLTQQPIMSNVAHIMTPGYARRLLSSLSTIAHTSDVWVHRVVPAMGTAYCVTVTPLLATDLSYNPQSARFASRIHPKGITESDMEKKAQHVKRVTSEAEYDALVAQWIA